MDTNLDIQKILGLLADEERFKIIGAVALGAVTLENITEVTGLGNQVVMKSLVKLEGSGLITKEDTGYIFNVDVLRAMNREYNLTAPKKAPLAGIERFMNDGTIITYPSRHDDRMMVLEHVIKLFEPGRQYLEKEVNEKIKPVFPDFASMRRYLIDAGFFRREQKTAEGWQTVTYYRRLK